MATDNPTDQAPPPERGSVAYPGRVQNGDLYCDCEGNLKAQCRTVSRSKVNLGRKYWQCRKLANERCSFYIWDDDLPAAKAWLAQFGPPPQPEPETPTRKGKEVNLETPWTKAAASKRKRSPVSREVSDEGEKSGEKGDAGEGETESDEAGDPGSPSRKAAKRLRSDTPGKVLGGRVQDGGLPTPETGKRDAAATEPRTSKDVTNASAVLGDVIDLTEEDAPSELTTAVLDELRSANVELKASTEAMIGHLIDTEMDLHEAKMKRSQKTISRMKKRLDELEAMVLSLTGGEEEDAVDL